MMVRSCSRRPSLPAEAFLFDAAVAAAKGLRLDDGDLAERMEMNDMTVRTRNDEQRRARNSETGGPFNYCFG